MKQPVIAIVDPMSSGSFLGPEFSRRGAVCAAVLSSFTPAVMAKTLRLSDFEHVVRHDGDVDQTVQQLRELGVTAVVAGCEPAVELADCLSEVLGVRTNGTAMSEARRNKYVMQEALRSAGLRAIAQCVSADLDEVLAWCSEHNDWPVVVKPLRSAGTDGVRLCSTPEEVADAFSAVVGKVNCLGELNDAVLVQEYLKGTEWVVDTVSRTNEDGVTKHHISTFWKYDKKCMDGTFVYLSCHLVDSEGEEQERLRSYVFKVLDVLGVKNGPAHSEVMYCADGPCLVETGARMHGERGPAWATEALGVAQTELTADVYLDGSLFSKTLGTNYRVSKYIYELFLVCRRAGVLTSPLENDKIRALPAFHTMVSLVKTGERVERTRDLFTSPARIIFVSSDRKQILESVEAVRRMEESEGGLYDCVAEEAVECTA